MSAFDHLFAEAAARDDDVVQRYAHAMSRAARQVEAIELDLVGVTLTPGTVMVRAHPVDDSADTFMAALKDQLGAVTARPALDDRANVAGAEAEDHYCEFHGGTP